MRDPRQAKGRRNFVSETLRRIISPLPEDQKTQGFEPNLYTKALRRLARLLILLLRVNGRNRFSNELIQMLDPKVKVKLPTQEELVFRTGHGRLLWRAATLLSEEPLIIEWINKFQIGDCFYDVGANVGNYSLYAAKRGTTTFAFEPELNNVSLLYDNIFLNQLQGYCTPMPIALGDTTKIDVFYLKSLSKGDALHSIGRPSYLLNEPSGLPLKLDTLVMRLDDMVDLFGLRPPTKMKIEVDFNELRVLEGAEKTLGTVSELYLALSSKLEEHATAMEFLKARSFHIISQEDTLDTPRSGLSNYIFAKT